jgi:hypothetical protein
MRVEIEQVRNPDPKRLGKLVLRKETIKNLKANDFPKNLAADHPSDTCSEDSDCCTIIPHFTEIR